MGVSIRSIETRDRDSIADMLSACGAFSDEEVRVALAMVDESLAAEYTAFVALVSGDVAGYICAGRTPLTRSTWHVYWLCVGTSNQRRGVGSALEAHLERFIAEQGGERVVVETSGRPDYLGTRRFYEHAGYQIVGRIPNYYKPGDDCVFYWKTVCPPV
jgi:ribosomal protein S18 acetylase RimI-like enzyme